MRDVTLVEVDGDGEHLVLTDSSGERYRLRIDEQLRAAARRDTAWLTHLQSSAHQAPLRPREIQARIRAGMSAEQLAAATAVPVENIRRYEGPVLAERQHVAEQAQKVAVARTATGDTSLAEAVAERLTVRGVDAEADWDSWREDADTWIVQVAFEAAGRARAGQWAYHPADATLEPLDDEARWLSGRPEPETQSSNERVFDVEAGGGVREKKPAEAAPPPAAPAEPAADDVQARTLDLLDALRGRRGQRQPISEESYEQPDLVDALLEDSEVAPPPAHPPASTPEQAVDAAILSLPEPQPDSQEDPADHQPEQQTQRPRRGTRQAKRASVPSWDDIMFGVKKD